MALVTKTNTFTGGTTAVASEVNTNFDTIYNDYNGNITNANCSASMNLDESKINFTGTKVVRLTTDQTVAGIKTFTSFPVTPSSAPTTDYQVSNKKYVDDQVAAVGAAVPTGSITMYGGAAAPTGFVLCQGQAINRTTYADLFTAIGTTYGVGDGATTFNVPDLQDRFPVGKGSTFTLGDQGAGRDGTLLGSGSDIYQKSTADNATKSEAGGGGGTTYAANTHQHSYMVPYSTINFIIKT